MRPCDYASRQLTLQMGPPLTEGGDSFSVSDPSFTKNKTQPVHRWVPWIAGFSGEFVRGIIAEYLPKRKGIILDPFAGVGTSLVEAILNGHRAIGFEINPYAAFVCKVKTEISKISCTKLKNEMQRFRAESTRWHNVHLQPKSAPPPGFQTRGEFYSPSVLRKVLLLKDFISSVSDPRVRSTFRLAFAATMIRYSNYSYEPSLSRRISAGKEEIEDFPVAELIFGKCSEVLDDISFVRHHSSVKEGDAKIYRTSFFHYKHHLRSHLADLLITSPPYLNNYHYNRNTRPHLYWLDCVSSPREMKVLEEENFGQYWQTVRELERVDLNFQLPALAKTLEELREQNTEKGIYSGNGWANYAARYFNDCYRFVKLAHYALRRECRAFVVVGNSILHGKNIAVDQYLAQIAEMVGLEVAAIHIPRSTRVGSSIIGSGVRLGGSKKIQQLYEAVLELKKR